jgi:nucleoside-diphosphate kinase
LPLQQAEESNRPSSINHLSFGGLVAVSLTLGILKPDALESGNAGKIIAHLEQAGFTMRAARVVRLTQAQAGAFYEVHRERPFFGGLVSFMTSGPCLPMALEREDAVATLRTVIGATDPAEAAAGTIRKLFAESKGRNAIHASDSPENAAREVGFFFPEGELAGLWG